MSIFQKFDYLPATILSNKPFIFGCFFEDFTNRILGFKNFYFRNSEKHKTMSALFMLGYHYETPERILYAKNKVEQIRELMPKLKLYFLCNSEKEKENFESIGCRAIYCNQNAFLNENRYHVLNIKKKFDAVYLARMTPIKRHELALATEKLLLIGDYFERESKHAEAILANRRADSVWIRKVRGVLMFYYLNRAKVGLCLSPEEGAMYACAEYGLCGLPVLTTECLGGRENSLAPEYTKIISQNPTALEVAAAVKQMNEKTYDSKKIREATIQVLNSHRARYRELGREIFDETKEGTEKDYKMFCDFPHKLGVRCRVLPLFRYRRSLKIGS